MSYATFDASHVLVLSPAIVDPDSPSHWIHMIVKNHDGLDPEVVTVSSNMMEYKDKLNNLFTCIKGSYGYLIEINKSPLFNLFDWIKEEMGLEEMYPDDYYLDDMHPEHVDVAGIGTSGGQSVLWLLSTQRIQARYFICKDASVTPLSEIELNGVDDTCTGIALEDPQTFLTEQLTPELIETQVPTFGLNITLYVRPSWTDYIQYN